MAEFYLVMRRRPNGNETEITRTSTATFTDEQIRVLRETTLTSGRFAAGSNGWRVIVYGPTEGTAPHTADDIVWDSNVDL